MKIQSILKKLSYISLAIYSSVSYGLCTVPKSIENTNFIMINNSAYSSDNPMAGKVYHMNYKSGGKYSYKILNDSNEYHGDYTYQVIAGDIGRITSTERFGNVPTEYTITLMCNNQSSGSYFYQQTIGVGEVRSNSAIYMYLGEQH